MTTTIPPAPPRGLDLGQDTWWRTQDGLIHLVDDLEPRHRANIAGWLVAYSAPLHARKRWRELWWFPLGVGYDVPDDVEPYSDDEIRRIIYREQERGEHLDWVRGSVLFRRMIREVEDLLPPGTMP